MACSPGEVSARAAVPARGAGMLTGALGASNGGCSRPAAQLASRSPGCSPISDVPAPCVQPVCMCKPSPSVSGHLSLPRCERPPPRLPCPDRDGLSCLWFPRPPTVLSPHYGWINFRSMLSIFTGHYGVPCGQRSLSFYAQGVNVVLLGGSRVLGVRRCRHPQLSQPVHRLVAFLHKPSTRSCTERSVPRLLPDHGSGLGKAGDRRRCRRGGPPRRSCAATRGFTSC